jgi:plastocyanin
MSEKMSGSTKAVLVLMAIVAVIIPIAVGVALIHGPLALPSTAHAPSATRTTSSAVSGAQTVTIPLGAGSGLNFSPSALTVSSGTTITFVNQDTATHNVDFTSMPAGASIPGGTPSGNLKQGDTYTVTLTTPGTYTYVCDYHNWMQGTITVTG